MRGKHLGSELTLIEYTRKLIEKGDKGKKNKKFIDKRVKRVIVRVFFYIVIIALLMFIIVNMNLGF